MSFFRWVTSGSGYHPFAKCEKDQFHEVCEQSWLFLHLKSCFCERC